MRNAETNAGMSVEELELLDAVSLAAKKAIDESVAILDAGAARAEKFFAEFDAIKRGKAGKAGVSSLCDRKIKPTWLEIIR